MENWKNIVGLEDFYEISDLGNIKSKVRKGMTLYGERSYGGNLLKPIIHKSGYACVNLTVKGFRKQFLVHRLVLETFVGFCPTGMEACHSNGNRLDCTLSNLRWDTRSNNSLDKRKHKTWQGGQNNGNSKLTNEQAKEIKSSKLSLQKLSNIYRVGKTTISRIKKGKSYNLKEINLHK